MSAIEQHYTVPQLQKLWAMSKSTVIDLFKDELGVAKIGNNETRFKRKRVVLKIPESVMRRVHARITQ